MDELLLSLTTRGVRYDTRQYLADVQVRSAGARETARGLPPDTPFVDALRLLGGRRDRQNGGPPMEYGCFDLDGTLIEDPGERFTRQRRPISANTTLR